MNHLWELTSRPHVSRRGGILTSRWERSRLNRGGRFPVLWRSPRNSGPHRDNFTSKPSSLLTCAAFNADVGAFAARESKPPRADEARTPRAQRRHDVRVAIGMPRHIFLRALAQFHDPRGDPPPPRRLRGRARDPLRGRTALRLLLVGADRVEGTCPKDTAAVFEGLVRCRGDFPDARNTVANDAHDRDGDETLHGVAMEGVDRVDMPLVGPNNARLDSGVEPDVFHTATIPRRSVDGN